jgi:tetratricopeptide (TPR) repeat protein
LSEVVWSGSEKVMSAEPPSSEAMTVQALIRGAKELRTQGQVRTAVPLLERATLLEPSNVSAWTQLAYTLLVLNRFWEAAWAYQRVVELDPDDASSWRNLGYAFRMLHRPREELVAYDRAIALEPDHVEVWNRRATALQRLGRFAEMLQASERARALDATNVVAWYNAGAAYASLRRYPEALGAFERTLALDPTEAWYWGEKARVLARLRRYEEALGAIEHGLTLAPKDQRVWQAKVRILWRMRRFRQMWRALVHTSTLQVTLSQLPVPTEEEEAADREASTLRGLWMTMLLVPWRRMDREAFATADLALVERVGSWALWLYGLLYVLAGVALSALWLTKSGSVTLGVIGMALCILTTGLFGLLAQALGAGTIQLLGKIFPSAPDGRTSMRAYLKYLRFPLLLVASLLAIPIATCLYALVATRSLSVANQQQALLAFVGGMVLVAVIALVVNRLVARKTARPLSPPVDSTLTAS